MCGNCRPPCSTALRRAAVAALDQRLCDANMPAYSPAHHHTCKLQLALPSCIYPNVNDAHSPLQNCLKMPYLLLTFHGQSHTIQAASVTGSSATCSRKTAQHSTAASAHLHHTIPYCVKQAAGCTPCPSRREPHAAMYLRWYLGSSKIHLVLHVLLLLLLLLHTCHHPPQPTNKSGATPSV